MSFMTVSFFSLVRLLSRTAVAPVDVIGTSRLRNDLVVKKVVTAPADTPPATYRPSVARHTGHIAKSFSRGQGFGLRTARTLPLVPPPQ
jgi:hypothetical protein